MTSTATRDMLAIETFSLQDESYHQSDRHQIVYRHAELSREAIRDEVTGTNDYARILLRIGVDETFDQVSIDLVQSGDLAALDRAIGTLEAVRAELVQLYGNRGRRLGRCMASGDWGRCHSDDGHDGPHELPTEAGTLADARVLAAARTRQATAS